MKKTQTDIFLETARLKILVPRISDLGDQFLLQSDPQVMKFIGSGIRTQDEVRTSVEKAVVHYEKFGFSLGSVFEKATEKFVGRAGLIHLGFDEKANEIEVAYDVNYNEVPAVYYEVEKQKFLSKIHTN